MFVYLMHVALVELNPCTHHAMGNNEKVIATEQRNTKLCADWLSNHIRSQATPVICGKAGFVFVTQRPLQWPEKTINFQSHPVTTKDVPAHNPKA
jgi:hypothetical protein